MSGANAFIPIAKPLLAESEMAAVTRPIRSGWVSQGPEVAAFEQEFATCVDSGHACAVSSCTAALHLALLAVGVAPGDEVITPSHSFVAAANAIRYCQARPVFVDIVPETFNLDPARVAAVVSNRTKAILCVHQLGMPCDLTAILAIARRHRVFVIEDAACAIGSEIRTEDRWERIGKPHGDIACFSFHPRKVVTTGEGGMLTTHNAEWDQRFRLWRQHCMSVPDAVRHSAGKVIFEAYPNVGFNYRMTDMQAAVGREQLKRLPAIVDQRRTLGARYGELLKAIPGLETPVELAWAKSNWQSYCVRLPAGCEQRRVMQAMLDAGIATRRGVTCAHREAAYPPGTWTCGASDTNCDCRPGECRRLVHSEQAQDRTIMLPLFPQMTRAQQDRVVMTLKQALRA